MSVIVIRLGTKIGREIHNICTQTLNKILQYCGILDFQFQEL